MRIFVLGALVFLAACKPAPTAGTSAHCTCTYLTDFDDSARVDVDVCVGAGRDQQTEAVTCAGEAAHNHIDRCDCAKAPGAACDPQAKNACVTK